MLGIIVDIAYPDSYERVVRKIRAFFEQKITADGFVQDMMAAGIGITLNTPGLYVQPEPLDGAVVEVPCKTCGKPTGDIDAQRCTLCCNVEMRLKDYIESPAG